MHGAKLFHTKIMAQHSDSREAKTKVYHFHMAEQCQFFVIFLFDDHHSWLFYVNFVCACTDRYITSQSIVTPEPDLEPVRQQPYHLSERNLSR